MPDGTDALKEALQGAELPERSAEPSCPWHCQSEASAQSPGVRVQKFG